MKIAKIRRFAFVPLLCVVAFGAPAWGGDLDTDGDGVPNGVDICPGTEMPELAPTEGLENNNYALLTSTNIFWTVESDTAEYPSDLTTVDTAGCSCTQIYFRTPQANEGHLKHGCSAGFVNAFTKNYASRLIFADGFESGDTLEWSQSVPPPV